MALASAPAMPTFHWSLVFSAEAARISASNSSRPALPASSAPELLASPWEASRSPAGSCGRQ